MKFALPALVFAVSLSAFAAQEKDCMPEALRNMPERGKDELRKMYREQRRAATRTSFLGQPRPDGKPYQVPYVRFVGAKDAKNPIVISPGFGEFAGKYNELAYDLSLKGYGPIYVIDHRGQGQSPELINGQKQRAFMDDMDKMAKDLLTLVQIARKENNGVKPHLVAHSMGGAVSARALQINRDENAKKGEPGVDVNNVVMSAPMWKINEQRMSFWGGFIASAGCTLFRSSPLCMMCRGGEGNWKGPNLTHSQVRLDNVEWQARIWNARNVCSTPAWAAGAIEGTLTLRADFLDNNTWPANVKVLQASDDKIVDNATQDRLCTGGNGCSLTKIDRPGGCFHELYVETDECRKKVLNELFCHLESTGGAAGASPGQQPAVR